MAPHSSWRPFFSDLQDWPLGLCDWESVDVDNDLTPSDTIFPTNVAETLQVHENAGHKWYFLTKQSKDEVLLFKIFDSDEHSSRGAVLRLSTYLPPHHDKKPKEKKEKKRRLVFPSIPKCHMLIAGDSLSSCLLPTRGFGWLWGFEAEGEYRNKGCRVLWLTRGNACADGWTSLKGGGDHDRNDCDDLEQRLGPSGSDNVGMCFELRELGPYRGQPPKEMRILS